MKKLTIDQVKLELQAGGCEFLDCEYINNITPFAYKCSCGNISKITLCSFKSGARCIECKKRKLNLAHKYDLEYVREELSKMGHTLLSTEYHNSKTPLHFRCGKCGEETNMTFSNIRNFNCKNCKRIRMSGENSPVRNHSKSDDARVKDRSHPLYRQWVTMVFERDNYTCQCCNKKSDGDICSHHLNGYSWYVEGRFDINNGVTLCEVCHDEFHFIYGKRNVHVTQFKEFMEGKGLHFESPLFQSS